MAKSHLGVEIERLVFDDVVMLQLSNIDEVGLDGLVMFVLHFQDLYSKHFPVFTVDASLNHSMRSFSQLLLYLVDLLECVFSKAVLEALS